MTCDLQRVYGDAARVVPTGDDDAFTFSADNLPPAPEQLATDRLIVRKGIHDYQAYATVRVDMLIAEARKATYRFLALALLSRVFHPAPHAIRLQLTHPASEIRAIVLDFDPARDVLTWIPGYHTRAVRFTYAPAPLTAYPLAGARSPEGTLPSFSLTNAQDMIDRDADWRARDVVRCAGSDSGHVHLASVLLNLARPEEPRDEVTLESEHGNGGVARGSAEARFVLPGSLSWSGEL
jgi:hypothetical protein